MWSACIQIWTEGLVLDRPYSSYFWTLRGKILKLQIFSRTFVVINLLQLIIHGQNQNSKIGLRKNRFVWNFELIVIYFCWNQNKYFRKQVKLKLLNFEQVLWLQHWFHNRRHLENTSSFIISPLNAGKYCEYGLVLERVLYSLKNLNNGGGLVIFM